MCKIKKEIILKIADVFSIQIVDRDLLEKRVQNKKQEEQDRAFIAKMTK